MKDLLINTLSTMGYPVRLQGSLGEEEEYPNSFFTFWNNDTSGDEFYDNEEHSCVWDFDLNLYSVDPNIAEYELLNAKKLLKEKGFIVSGKGYDVMSGESTHTGRGINVKYKE